MRKALVIGLGISGRAAVEFLLASGYAVMAVDKNEKTLVTIDVVRLRIWACCAGRNLL
jgi:UDP-N-acetylmuramoylalanine-D-glutamate ligase